jgi:hypothetical protein
MTLGFDEIQLEKSPVGNIVTLTFKGKVDKEDYDIFVPQIEGLMEGDAKIRLVVELRDFKGWSAGALWEETKFAARHFNDIERLAIVGEAEWEKSMAAFIKPFTMAKVRYFDRQAADQALVWIRENKENV